MFTAQLRKLALLLGLFSFALSACSLSVLREVMPSGVASWFGISTASDELETTIHAIIDENMRASREEDLDAYMNAIHPDTPLYDDTERLMETAFENYDLAYEIEIGDITLLESGDVSVEFVLTTTKIRGGAFRDNEVTGIFYLRQDGTAWKFINQEYTNIRYLN